MRYITCVKPLRKAARMHCLSCCRRLNPPPYRATRRMPNEAFLATKIDDDDDGLWASYEGSWQTGHKESLHFWAIHHATHAAALLIIIFRCSSLSGERKNPLLTFFVALIISGCRRSVPLAERKRTDVRESR